MNGIRNLIKFSNDDNNLDVGIVEYVAHRGRDGKTKSTAEIYFYNDQGTRHIPKRPTLKPAIEDHNFKNDIKKLMRQAVSGRGSLDPLGKELVKSVQQKIIKLKSPALAPSTIRRKGSSDPLRDTDQLLKSIDYKIND